MEVFPGVEQSKSLHNFCIKKLPKLVGLHGENRKSAGKLKQHQARMRKGRMKLGKIVMEFPSDSFVCDAMPFTSGNQSRFHPPHDCEPRMNNTKGKTKSNSFPT